MTSKNTDEGDAVDAAGSNSIECDRCGVSVPIADASQLEKKDNKALWKILCPDCLRAVGVPSGYTLQRDLSHLE